MLSVGGSYNHRHVNDPIFHYLDYMVEDYGGFLRAVDDRQIGGLRNRLVVGGELLNGTLDGEQYVNDGGEKGALTTSTLD